MKLCKSCRFSDDWKAIPEHSRGLKEGWCHRLPPVMSATGVSFTPVTSAFWCGEWRWLDPVRRFWRFLMKG